MRNKPTRQTSHPAHANQLLELWLEDLRADHSPATLRRYQSAIQRFLAWYEAEERQPLDIRHLTPIALVGYRTALQHTQATRTVNTHVSALRAWCRWLAETGHLSDDPAARLKLVARQPGAEAPRFLKHTEINALLRAAGNGRHPERDIAILQMLIQTGLRIGECAALNWQDIHFGEKRGQVFIRAGKGNKARTVPLNGSVRQALAGYAAPRLGVEPSPRAVARAWPRRDPDRLPTALWQSQKGGRMTTSAISRLIDGLVRDCASRQLLPASTSAHTLRHTFATHYLKTHPGDLVGLAALLGHTSLNTTRIYVQPTAEELAERVERIGLNAYE